MYLDLRTAPLAIVDLETTGGRAGVDRIIEIAVIEVEGFKVVSEWSTLVDPGIAIPFAIQGLTGITQEMLAAAPNFRQLAPSLFERLAGRVFVAHNVPFDYGFLRREFERAGLKYRAETLCSVRLSRRLYPADSRHDLDSLIARHGIDCRSHHRALGDADALWQFLRVAASEHGADVVSVAARQIATQPSLPAQIDPAAIDEIPEARGVYVFYGESGAALYVGRSTAMRSRVLSHFSSGLRSEKKVRLARELRRIEWQRTAGELGARLRETKLVRELAPAFNRRRPPRTLTQTEIAAWPYRGALGIVEKDRASDSTEVHVIDRWCYLGTARSDEEVAELLERGREPRFDPEHYRIFARHLGKRRVHAVDLAA